QKNAIRQTLIESGNLAKFAALFGQSLTNNTVISIIITLLNNKRAPELRAAFYQQICPLLGFAGSQSISFLQPLIEEGLSDADETVLESCLRLVTKMQSQFLSGPSSVDILQRVFPLTIHPCARVRQSAVAFITTFARTCLDNSKLTPAQDSSEIHNFVTCSAISVYARLSHKRIRPFFKFVYPQLTIYRFITFTRNKV
ncbi:phosphoinositide-3-kinase, regulatory subunit 4, partial [Cichlidogyrus casuarinus]